MVRGKIFLYRTSAVLKVETRHYRLYHSKSDRMTCNTSDNVCQDVQNWCYCFYQWRKMCLRRKMCLMSHSPIIFIMNISQFLCMRVTNWRNIFVDQGQFSDPDLTIRSIHQRKNVQFVDKLFFDFFLCYTGHGYNFNGTCPKIAIKNFRVGTKKLWSVGLEETHFPNY